MPGLNHQTPLHPHLVLPGGGQRIGVPSAATWGGSVSKMGMNWGEGEGGHCLGKPHATTPRPDPQPGALTCVLSARYLRPRVTCPGWSHWEGLGEGGSWTVDVGLSPSSFCSTSSFHPDASGCGSLSTDYVQGACPTSTPAHLLPDGPRGSIS